MSPVPEGQEATPIRVPPSLVAALGITSSIVVVVGVYPQVLARFGDLASLVP